MTINQKTYQLIWTNGTYKQHLSEGGLPKLIAERARKRKEFIGGKMIIIST